MLAFERSTSANRKKFNDICLFRAGVNIDVKNISRKQAVKLNNSVKFVASLQQ